MNKLSFGGPWTQEKLDILRRYLDAYTTALKNRPFRLIYLDAFAGPGLWSSRSGYERDYDDFRELHEGSPRIALGIQDRSFDRLIFIEKDPTHYESLKGLHSEFLNRDIMIYNEDANDRLPRFCDTLGPTDRAVVFLDPFATQVSWTIVENLASTQKVDCWILFPLSAIARMMSLAQEPPPKLAARLDRIFGERTHWQNLYGPSRQLSLLGDSKQERTGGSDRIAALYRARLESVFAKVAPSDREFRNSKNGPMFRLFFAASNPKGATIAVRIAKHILDHW